MCLLLLFMLQLFSGRVRWLSPAFPACMHELCGTVFAICKKKSKVIKGSNLII